MADSVRDTPEVMAARVANEIYAAWRATANRDAYVGSAIMQAATEAVSAALAGRQVVDLPEPDGTREQLDGVLTYWNVDGWSVAAKNDMVSISTGPDGIGGGLGFRPEVSPRIASALLAAVSRLAAGSGVGDQDV